MSRITHPLTLSLTALALGCAPDDGAGADGQPATVLGRVDASGDAAFASTTTVEDDGGTTPSSAAPTPVDSDGSFVLLVDVEAQASAEGDVLVEAWDGAQLDSAQRVGAAIVAEALVAGEETATAPLDAETTAEADVWSRLRATDTEGLPGSSAWLRARVTAELATAVDRAPSRSAAVDQVAEAEAAAMATFVETLEVEGMADGSVDAALASMGAAYVTFDGDAYAASDEAAATEAEAALETALDGVWTRAGWTRSQVALSQQLSAEVTATLLADADASVAAASRVDAGLRRADAVVSATVEGFETLGAEATTLTSVEDAGVALRGRLKEAAGDPADADAAWDDFRTSVETALTTTLTTEEAGVVLTLQTTLAQAVDALVDARTTAGGDAASDVVVDAFVDAAVAVWGTATADAQVELLTAVGLSDAEATALLRVLAHLELATA